MQENIIYIINIYNRNIINQRKKVNKSKKKENDILKKN